MKHEHQWEVIYSLWINDQWHNVYGCRQCPAIAWSHHVYGRRQCPAITWSEEQKTGLLAYPVTVKPRQSNLLEFL